MAKYNVSFIVYASYDVEVEADSRRDAIEKAKPFYESASLGEFDYIDERDVYVEEI